MSKARYARSQRVLAADVGDDFVALNVEDGQCYGMEKVTAAVWRLLGDPRNIDEICDHLIQRYDVSPGACHEAIRELIGKMLAEGLVEPSSNDGPQA